MKLLIYNIKAQIYKFKSINFFFCRLINIMLLEVHLQAEEEKEALPVEAVRQLLVR